MGFKAAEAAVRAFFSAQWNSATPVAWPDVSFTPPNGTWVRFSMKNNIGHQASMGSPGSNLFRRRGIITIQVFQKEGQGSTDARTKAELAADIFIEQKLTGFTFSNVNARDIGADGAGWYQWNVTAEYKYDRIT
jgi:hypothetical protein